MLGMQEASMKLTESLHEVYEPDWYGREDVKMVGEVKARWQHTGGLGVGSASARLPSSPTHSDPTLLLLALNHDRIPYTQKALYNSATQIISNSVISEPIIRPLG